MAARLSKSRFAAGLQCLKQLWWRVHEPDAPELVPDRAQQAVFDQGTMVGERAREYVPGGVLIDLPHDRMGAKIAATRQALDAGAQVIYEASFSAERVFVAVDILERRKRGWGLIEVKSSTKLKDEHVPDAAIQTHVLRRSGLDVTRVEVMHLNRECVFPDLSNLFAREDVTEPVEELLPDLPVEIVRQLRALEGPLPDVAIGDHCSVPYECPFWDRCWRLPEHHVSTLYLIGRRAAELEAQGYTTIHQLPANLGLSPAAERQRRAVQCDQLLVEPALGRALTALRRPLAFLDFETVNPAIPVWKGCRPWDPPVPVQFSCHAERPDGGFAHHEWIADGPGDPRLELVRRVAAACRGARSVVAYNANFERRCLQCIAAALPELAGEVEDVVSRLVDPLPIVRDHVYHPDFGGSFSLKAVLPALVPELSYEGMEIDDGTVASVELAHLLFAGEDIPPAERDALREALRKYCALDTWGMVRLVERLRELA